MPAAVRHCVKMGHLRVRLRDATLLCVCTPEQHTNLTRAATPSHFPVRPFFATRSPQIPPHLIPPTNIEQQEQRQQEQWQEEEEQQQQHEQDLTAGTTGELQ